jgi:hypothetical protein
VLRRSSASVAWVCGGVLFIAGGARSIAAAVAGAPGVEAAGAGADDASVDGESHPLCLCSANIFCISSRRIRVEGEISGDESMVLRVKLGPKSMALIPDVSNQGSRKGSEKENS